MTAFLSNAVASPTAACAFQECSRALGELTFLSHSDAAFSLILSPSKELVLSFAPLLGSAPFQFHFVALWMNLAMCNFVLALLPVRAESDPIVDIFINKTI